MPENSVKNQRKVLLIDDHPIVSLGIKTLLEDSSDFVLSQVATCNQEAMVSAEKELPDIIILDLVLPGRNGMEIIPEFRKNYPKCLIVVYSSLQEELYAIRAIRAGARSFVHKEAGLPRLLDALYAMCNGKIFVSEKVQQDMLNCHSKQKKFTNDLSTLSNQELNVFRLIGNGLRLSNIAAQLGISPKTVGTHRERIKNKLTLHSGKELDQLAMSCFSSLPNQVESV